MSTSPSPRPASVRLYRLLLKLLPAELGDRFGDDAADVFFDLYREALRDHGRVGAAALWSRSVGQLFLCSVRGRGDARRATLTMAGASGTRAGRGGDPMGAFMQDLTFAVRTLVKRPGFALTAIAILATGIGATTTIFSVVDTVILRQLPYPDAGRLVHFDNGAHSFPSFRAWREMSSFESVAAAWDQDVDLTGEAMPERLPAAEVSQQFFRTMGAAPHLGRLFTSSDFPGQKAITVLDHGTWQRRFGADPDVLGRTVRLNGSSVEVVGVLSEDFLPPEITTGSRVEFWFPLGDGGDDANDHGMHTLGVVARLAAGVSMAAAQAEVDAQRASVAEEVPEQYINRDGSIEMTPLVELREATAQGVSGMLWVLLASVGILLLIACANVANLFLARGTSRAREIALRGALGASRSRITVQILTESVLLALAGGVSGVLLAFGGAELIALFNPGGIPRIEQLSVDGRVLAFSVFVSVATGVLFGWLPALQAIRGDVNEALKDGAAAVTAGRGGRRTRNGLIVAEIALAVVLLVGGGLLMRTFVAMVQVDPGFDTDRMLVLPLETDAGYTEEERLAFAQELIGRLETLPGVAAVSGGWAVPFTTTGRSRCCWRTNVIGDPALSDEDQPYLSIVHPVTQNYFRTLRAPIVAGRDFEREDMTQEADAAILNRRTALELFGTEDVLGRTLRVGGDQEQLTVVGVVDGVHHWGLNQGVQPAVYVAYGRFGGFVPRLNFAVRANVNFENLAAATRDAVWAIDPDLPIAEIVTMEDRVSSSLATPRFLSGLIGGFALVALLLACGGVYGSMLYTVGQRRRELGIRIALGAERLDVIGLVLRYGAMLALFGIVLGSAVGFAMTRALEQPLVDQLLWGVEPTDPVTFVGVAVLLGTTALLASFLPAWTASRTDPLETLKAE